MEAAGPSPVGSRRYLVVRAGGTRYGLPVQCVRRVIRAPELWPVPGAEPQLLGLIQYGGEPLAVLDLALLAAAEGSSSPRRDVVVVLSLAADLAVGLAVEDAEQVWTVDRPAGGEGAEGGGVGDRPDMRLLEVDTLFGAECRVPG